jgi:LPPG:FO 2-phospho-L-lactate transferase
MREAIAASPAPVVAVSPFVRGAVLKGPTDAFCAMAALPTGTRAIEQAYADLIDGVVADQSADLPARVVDVLMDTPEARARVASDALEFARSLVRGG